MKGQNLYKSAKKIIPGGNMLLSKRPEMFLPNNWPSYYSKSKKISVWDLDGNKYVDMSLMGIGTNILGYGNYEVDKAVKNTIKHGNMSTLNCPEEVYLAEKLISMHSWADMVRFARSGGEANSIAIRIARASSQKDKVAICGYHGWHDWYLSVNLRGDNKLEKHLLSGLKPNGVPKDLKSTVFPFQYGNIDQLIDILSNNEIGTIKMEVCRNTEPDVEFLKKVRNLANKKNIILIFDECTSGFRKSFGGIHLNTGVNPDISIFGKALGNGYAITSIIGKREIMESAQDSFISSTFWTERIGPSAALKTLEIMEKLKSWEIITRAGELVKKEWNNLAESHDIKIDQWGISSLPGFTINSKYSLEYKTLITQEMLKKGYLSTNSIYLSICHTDKIIKRYIDNLSDVFYKISQCEKGNLDIFSLLNGPVCHSGFNRLN